MHSATSITAGAEVSGGEESGDARRSGPVPLRTCDRDLVCVSLSSKPQNVYETNVNSIVRSPFQCSQACSSIRPSALDFPDRRRRQAHETWLRAGVRASHRRKALRSTMLQLFNIVFRTEASGLQDSCDCGPVFGSAL